MSVDQISGSELMAQKCVTNGLQIWLILFLLPTYDYTGSQNQTLQNKRQEGAGLDKSHGNKQAQ